MLAAPYVALNVATMNALGLDSELTAQIARGNAVTAATLHVTPSPQTWAEPGALSGAGIDDLIGRGVTQMVVDGSSLAPLPSGVSAVTVAQPFQLTGRDGRRVAAVATDPGLEAHFNDGPSQVLAAHQLLADLAMIQQEQPNATRGVVVTIPSSWPVNPAFLATLLDGLQGSPMVTPMTVGRLFSDVAPLQTQRSGPVVRTVADQQPPGPTMTDAPAIRAARAALTGLASMAPTEPTLTDDPQRLLLIAQSADLPDRQRPVELAAATKVDQRGPRPRPPTSRPIHHPDRPAGQHPDHPGVDRPVHGAGPHPPVQPEAGLPRHRGDRRIVPARQPPPRPVWSTCTTRTPP